VALVRLWACARLPVNTGDTLRFVHQALYVLRDGPGSIARSLAELDPGLAGLSWADVPYSYPPLALPFFVAVAAVSPTLFAAKLALTLVEAVNALLVSRITESRVLGLLYWASPASIWWVSGEGQFEPLMAVFMLGAVALRTRSAPAAFALLALGIQVKLTAVLLLPWLMFTTWKDRRADVPKALGAFALALLVPSLVAGLFYPVMGGLVNIAGTIRYNPYYWNVLDRARFLWNPGWMITTNALVTYGVLAFMGWRAVRSGDIAGYSGAIGFVILVKVSSLAQFWYFLLFPAFAAPISERRVRWWLIALAPLLDVHSLTQLIFGPYGWIERGTYDGLSAFTSFGIR